MEFDIKYYFENTNNSDEIFVKDIIKDSTNILDMYKNSNLNEAFDFNKLLE